MDDYLKASMLIIIMSKSCKEKRKNKLLFIGEEVTKTSAGLIVMFDCPCLYSRD